MSKVLVPVLASIAAAVVAGFLQIVQPNLLVTVTFILVAGIALGAMWPDNSWVWGIILGTGIPAAYVIAPMLGVSINEAIKPNVLITFAAILPAIAGTTTGVVFRFTNSRPADS